MNGSALIIGAAAIAAIFVVWRVASKPAAPPPALADKCAVSYGGATVSCSTIKAGAAVIKKVAVGAERGIASVPGALLGTNKSVSLFGQATGTVAGPLRPGVRGVA